LNTLFSFFYVPRTSGYINTTSGPVPIVPMTSRLSRFLCLPEAPALLQRYFLSLSSACAPFATSPFPSRMHGKLDLTCFLSHSVPDRLGPRCLIGGACPTLSLRDLRPLIDGSVGRRAPSLFLLFFHPSHLGSDVCLFVRAGNLYKPRGPCMLPTAVVSLLISSFKLLAHTSSLVSWGFWLFSCLREAEFGSSYPLGYGLKSCLAIREIQ
jgi:hypothetical protein